MIRCDVGCVRAGLGLDLVRGRDRVVVIVVVRMNGWLELVINSCVDALYVGWNRVVRCGGIPLT